MTDETVMTETCDLLTEAVDTTEPTEIEPKAEDEAEAQAEADDPNETEALRDEILTLRQRIAELEAERDTQSRLIQEVADFSALFPDVELELIPESVWDSVRKGTPLMASYALYEKRMRAEEARIADINASNASRSAGVVGKDTAGEYFSPDEVRRMSPSEVHANYSKIKESMKKWI